MAEIFGDIGYLHLMIGRPGRPLQTISGKPRHVGTRPMIVYGRDQDRGNDILKEEILEATFFRMPCELILPEMFANISRDMADMAMAVLEGNEQAALELADRVLEAYHRRPHEGNSATG